MSFALRNRANCRDMINGSLRIWAGEVLKQIKELRTGAENNQNRWAGAPFGARVISANRLIHCN
jgi:hypothetical protein